MSYARPKKKYIVQVAGNPAFAQGKKKNDAIINPVTGTPTFGIYPKIERPEVSFAGGPILLRYGEHRGPNSGWGLFHIWQARFSSTGAYIDAEKQVTTLVSSILVGGASLHYENELGARGTRSSVFRGQSGVVIVEERLDGKNQTFYSVVTAFPAAKVHGYVIGNL